MADIFDFIIVGAGIAGTSCAHALSKKGSVLLLERESQPGYHTTGRSAAVFAETYGNSTILNLTKAGRAFFESPPDGLSDYPLLSRRGCLHIARDDQIDRLANIENAAAAIGIETIRYDPDAACRIIPALRREYLAGAVLESQAMDIDVAAFHQGLLKLAKNQNVKLMTGQEVRSITAYQDGWIVATGDGTHRGATLVNAAGAWADEIATLAGVLPVGIVPKRRTVCVFAPPPDTDISHWPLVVDVDEQFYFKPEAGMILASPADETPSDPCDAQPEEIDVAIAVDRVQKAAEIPVQHINRSWAGLRNFTSDKTPVVGPDPANRNFFWLAGQGGYGIQTAPAIARIASIMLTDIEVPLIDPNSGVELAALSPNRFAGNGLSIEQMEA